MEKKGTGKQDKFGSIPGSANERARSTRFNIVLFVKLQEKVSEPVAAGLVARSLWLGDGSQPLEVKDRMQPGISSNTIFLVLSKRRFATHSAFFCNRIFREDQRFFEREILHVVYFISQGIGKNEIMLNMR